MSDVSSLQCLDQQLPGAMELRTAGPFRGPSQFRDLIVLVPLDVVQHEDRARSRRQRADRSFEIDSLEHGRRSHSPEVRSTSFILRRPSCALRRLLFSHFTALTPLLPTNVAQHEVNRESIDPTRERRLTTPRAQTLPYVHEDILRQLRRTLARAAHSHAAREYATGVRAVPALARRLASGRGAAGELQLAVTVIQHELRTSAHRWLLRRREGRKRVNWCFPSRQTAISEQFENNIRIITRFLEFSSPSFSFYSMIDEM